MTRPHHRLGHPKTWFEVFLKSGGGAALMGGAALLVLTYFSVTTYLDVNRLATEGAFLQADITSRWIDRDDEGADKYYINLSYDVNGVRYRERAKVTSDTYRATREDDTLRIRYWTDGPSTYEVEVGSTKARAIKYQLAALVAGLIGCGVLWIKGGKAAKGVLSRRWGHCTTAEMTGWVERKNKGKPTGKGYMVFVTRDGLHGESLDHPIRTFRAIGIGGQINVYVRKGDVWWEGDVGPRILPRSSIPKVTG